MWRRVLHLRRYKFESRLTLRHLTIDPSPAQTAADTTSYWHRITVVVEKYTMMTTAAIRHELLNGTDEDLQKRRYIVTLSALGLVDFAFLSLYQSGIIKRLPDLPFVAFDSNKVNASPDAYQMGAPDATISAWVYATNMVLATAGGSKHSGRKPILDLILGTTVAANAAGAVYYLYNMAFYQRKICPYCVAGAAVNLASAVIMKPLLMNSLAKLFGKRR